MRRRYIALLSVLALLLASCASLPQRGAVTVVTKEQNPTAGVALNAKGPAAHATVKQIVQGFIQASAVGVSDDFQVARQFLTPEASARWSPSGAVSIYPDTESVQYSQSLTGAVVVTVGAQGNVDKVGRYSAAHTGTSIKKEFSLAVNEDGEWRIAALDDSLLMSQTLFSSLYTQAPLYFLASSNDMFVPDQRWYPRAKALSMMTSAILREPSGWLSRAAYSPYNFGVDQNDLSVSAEGATAFVDLPAGVAGLDRSSICQLTSQITHTLTASRLVQSVELSVQGALLDNDCASQDVQPPSGDSALLALKDTALVKIGDGKETLLREISQEEAQKFAFLGVDYSSPVRWVVGVSKDKSLLSALDLESGDISALAAGESLAAPSIDIFGWVWTVNNAQPDSIVATQIETGEQVAVPAPDLASGAVTKVAVSPEGARIVVAASGNDTGQVIAYGVERSEQGTPIAVGDPFWLGKNFSEVRDVAWMSDLDVALIGVSQKDGIDGLFTVEIGGEVEQISGVSALKSVVARYGEDSLIVLDAAGIMREYSESVWEDIATGIYAAAFPG